MKQRSRKAKGKKLQNFVREKLLKAFRHLKKNDVVCEQNYKPGADSILSKVAKKLCPYSFECKNQEKMKTIYDFYKQAQKNSGKLEPVLVMKMNTREPIVVIDFEHFIELIQPEQYTDPTDPKCKSKFHFRRPLETHWDFNMLMYRLGCSKQLRRLVIGDFRPP